MHWMTEDAVVVCDHELGHVGLVPTQELVRVADRRVLVATDPEGRPIVGCPNLSPASKPCLTTLAVREGYSAWVAIEGRPVCLASVRGYTDGTPPGLVEYKVRRAGQEIVGERP